MFLRLVRMLASVDCWGGAMKNYTTDRPSKWVTGASVFSKYRRTLTYSLFRVHME